MRWAFAKALWLLALLLNFVMWGHLYVAWMAGAASGRLVLMFFAYVIPICAMLSLRSRLREAQPRPTKARTTPIRQIRQESLPDAPQRPLERRFAVPPTVKVPIAEASVVPSSMPDRLRRFICDGMQHIEKYQ